MVSATGESRLSRQPESGRPNLSVSFEFFPPKTDAMEDRFWASLSRLAPLGPRFVSVTYGAGGSTRERTLRMVSRITNETGVPAAAHLTCVGATRDEVDDVVRGYAEAGVNRIVALRGDPPEGVGHAFTPHPNGYNSAADLVAGEQVSAQLPVLGERRPAHRAVGVVRADVGGHTAGIADGGGLRIATAQELGCTVVEMRGVPRAAGLRSQIRHS